MTKPTQVKEVSLEKVPWQQLQPLLDACYPMPPRDVFPRVIGGSHWRQRVWLAFNGLDLKGIVMLSPHSKGGHLENLAVHPCARGEGIARLLVQALIEQTSLTRPSIISLTTRIPDFFRPLGFQPFGQLSDGSTPMFMIIEELKVDTPNL